MIVSSLLAHNYISSQLNSKLEGVERNESDVKLETIDETNEEELDDMDTGYVSE